MTLRTRHALLGFALTASFLAAFIFTIPSAAAQYRCARGFYACNINADGSLDPNHPGCCLAVPGFQRACSPGFYACRYNAGGNRDPAHPGCCLNVPGVPHVR
jgi:hypothetical protein